MKSNRFKHKEITDKTIKGFYEVYNELRYGFLESVYEKALYIISKGYGLYVEMQKEVLVYFRGRVIGEFSADLTVNEKVIVEIKAVSNLVPIHEAQLINYLRSTNIEVGLLLNFWEKPQFKRFVYNNARKNISKNPRSPCRIPERKPIPQGKSAAK